MYGRSFKVRIGRVVATLCIACVMPLLALSVWNLVGTKRAHARNPVPGEFFPWMGTRCTSTAWVQAPRPW